MKTVSNFGLILLAALAMGVIGSGCSSHQPSTVVVVPPSSGGFPPSSGGYPPYVPPCSSGGDSCGCSTGSSGVCSSGGVPIGSGGSTGSSNGSLVIVSSTGGSVANSLESGTKDVDLQQAEIEQQQVEGRAQALASEFSMNIDAARQLTQISDKMAVLQAQANGMSDDDRAALAGAALNVAGISGDDVNQAYAAYVNGDHAAVNNLVIRAANNLGMPSDAGLREQLLPSLGINLGQQ